MNARIDFVCAGDLQDPRHVHGNFGLALHRQRLGTLPKLVHGDDAPVQPRLFRRERHEMALQRFTRVGQRLGFAAQHLDEIGHDAFIAAAPVHIGRFPAPFVHWVKERADALNGKRSAFVSVSLGIASQFEAEKREIEAIGEAFFAETGWHPGAVHHAAGALRYTRYDFLKRLLMRHIAAKEGGDVDTSEDHEYTDWDGLAAFVTGFLAADG